jgi:hypothetical protein
MKYVISAQVEVDEQEQNIEQQRAAARANTDGAVKARGY